MVRSATALLAVMILPALALAQESSRSHSVVDGDTLWDLAQTYYGDPFEWRRIWEANRQDVEDPNLILPGQVLVIPGVQAEVTDVVVEAPRERQAPPSAPATERTVFSEAGEAGQRGFIRGEEMAYAAVTRDIVLSAPRVSRRVGDPQNLGVVAAFAGGAPQTETPRTFDRVLLRVAGAMPSAGDQLQTFRVTRTIEGVGKVVMPTGIVTVSEVRDGEVIAVVSKEYDLMRLGDLIGPLPVYTLEPGRLAERVSGGSEAMVVGFANFEVIHDLGSVAFLDLGSNHGIAIGDEFEYVNPEAGSNVVEGRLQVVGVTPEMASARIVSMDDAVFEQGIVVRLSKKMR